MLDIEFTKRKVHRTGIGFASTLWRIKIYFHVVYLWTIRQTTAKLTELVRCCENCVYVSCCLLSSDVHRIKAVNCICVSFARRQFHYTRSEEFNLHRTASTETEWTVFFAKCDALYFRIFRRNSMCLCSRTIEADVHGLLSTFIRMPRNDRVSLSERFLDGRQKTQPTNMAMPSHHKFEPHW